MQLEGSTGDWLGVLDLVAILCGAVSFVVCSVLTPPLWAAIRPLYGGVFLLLCPGYALVSFAYPHAAAVDPHPGSTRLQGWVFRLPAISTVERVALAVALSIVLLPFVSALLVALTGTLRGGSLVVLLAAVTVVFGSGAIGRRLSLPAEHRYEVPIRRLGASFRGNGRPHSILNILLAIAILCSLFGLSYAVFVPQSDGESYTSLALLAENDQGTLVAGDYPTTFERGEQKQLTVRLRNEEGKPVQYTLFVVIERVTAGPTSTVGDRQIEHRFQAQLAPGEQVTKAHVVAPELSGDRIRLRYLLYRGDPGSEPAPEDAYRELSLWIDVEERS
jgi:uncharacterized membrane protein